MLWPSGPPEDHTRRLPSIRRPPNQKAITEMHNRRPQHEAITEGNPPAAGTPPGSRPPPINRMTSLRAVINSRFTMFPEKVAQYHKMKNNFFFHK